MEWLVEPFAGIKLLGDSALAAKTCSGTAVLNHCSCIFGLKKCDCSGGLVVEVEPEQQ